MMYHVIILSCFTADYNSTVLPHLHHLQQRHSSERWIGWQWLRSHSAQNHIFVSVSLYQLRMFPFAQYTDMVALLPFPRHHNFSSASFFFFHFFFFFSFCCSFFFSHHQSFDFLHTFFSSFLLLLYFTLLFRRLPFLVCFFSTPSHAIEWHNNKLIRA